MASENTLASTMSQLIKIIPETKPLPEPEGYKFGYYAFEELDPIKTEKEMDESVIFNSQMVSQFLKIQK